MSDSNWRNRTSTGSKSAHRGRGRAAPRGSQSNAPPKRHMEHIATVSRSSGIDKDGDTLKDFKVQEDYRAFLQGKLDEVLNKHPKRVSESEKDMNQRIYAQENVLILFRKLREGISSTRRNDTFALEVYEISLYLAIAFESPKQSTSIISHLVPGLYLASPSIQHNRLYSVLISLLHHLVVAYPSQSTFNQHLGTIPAAFLPRDSAEFQWITSVSKSLRTQNYTSFAMLTRPAHISQLLDSANCVRQSQVTSDPGGGGSASVMRQAMNVLVHSLREKARTTTWQIIRSAYREFSYTNEGTRTWLTHSLFLQSLVPHCKDIGVEKWMEERSALGHARQKEGVEGRWLVYKAQ